MKTDKEIKDIATLVLRKIMNNKGLNLIRGYVGKVKIDKDKYYYSLVKIEKKLGIEYIKSFIIYIQNKINTDDNLDINKILEILNGKDYIKESLEHYKNK